MQRLIERTKFPSFHSMQKKTFDEAQSTHSFERCDTHTTGLNLHDTAQISNLERINCYYLLSSLNFYSTTVNLSAMATAQNPKLHSRCHALPIHERRSYSSCYITLSLPPTLLLLMVAARASS